MGAVVNYNNSSNVYRVWDPSHAKVYNVGSPAFDEIAKPGWWRSPGADEGNLDVEFPYLLTYTAPVPAAPLQPAIVDMTPLDIADLSMDHDATPAIAVPAPASQPANLPASPAIILDSSTQTTFPRRSNRSNRGVPPLRLAEIMVAAIDESAADEPNTFKQAMKLPDAKFWREAMVAKVNSLIENKVYGVVDRPAHKRVVSSKWVFKKKRGIFRVVEKYKARLVARGFTQEEGVDYSETFAPTVRLPHVG